MAPPSERTPRGQVGKAATAGPRKTREQQKSSQEQKLNEVRSLVQCHVPSEVQRCDSDTDLFHSILQCFFVLRSLRLLGILSSQCVPGVSSSS